MGRSLPENAKNSKTVCANPHWVLNGASLMLTVALQGRQSDRIPTYKHIISKKSTECAQGIRRIFNIIESDA